MFFNAQYGMNAVFLLLISALVLVTGLYFEAYFTFFRTFGGLLLFSTVPTLILQNKKYKRDMKLKLINIEEEIKKFEEELEKDKKVLIDLKNNKNKNNIEKISKKNIIIDNTKNDRLINIEKQKHLYETYREWCDKILKKRNLTFLIDSETNNEDLQSIKEMSDRAVKILSKKKN